MEFFGMGFGEVLVILVVALLIFGPEKIPEIARTVARTMRGLRQMSSTFTTAVSRELELEEKQKSHKPQPPPAPTGPEKSAVPAVRDSAEVPPEKDGEPGASGKDG